MSGALAACWSVPDAVNDLLSPAEACAYLGLKAPITLRRWRKAGRLPVVRLSPTMVRYRRADLERLKEDALAWDAPAERQPRPIESAPSWLDLDAVNPLTGLTYRQMREQAR